MQEHDQRDPGCNEARLGPGDIRFSCDLDVTGAQACPVCQGDARAGLLVIDLPGQSLTMATCGSCDSAYFIAPIQPSHLEAGQAASRQDGAELLARLRPLFVINRPCNGRLLEVGRGVGALSNIWQSCGFGPALGLESPSTDQPGRTYDYIVSQGGIEQSDTPANILTGLSAALAEDGILVLQTPSARSLTPEHAPKMLLPNPPRFVASAQGLTDLLSRCGFGHLVVRDLGESLLAWASHAPLPKLATELDEGDAYLERLATGGNSELVGGALWLAATDARNRGQGVRAERLCESLLVLAKTGYGLDLKDPSAVLAQSRSLGRDRLPPWLGRALCLTGLIAQDKKAPEDEQIDLLRAAIEVLQAESDQAAKGGMDVQMSAAKAALVQAAALRQSSNPGLADPLPNYILRHPGPMAGKDLCLLTIYAPRGQVSGITTDYLDVMAKSGFAVIACLAVEDITAPVDLAALKSAAGIVVRQNGGMDFSCWSATLTLLPEIWTASRVVFTNDSIIALPAIFAPFAARLRDSRADLTGLTEALRPRHHVQSYFFMLQGKALSDPKVQEFWTTLPVLDHKSEIIDQYETRLLERAVMDWQLDCRLLFPIADLSLEQGHDPYARDNASHFYWEELTQAGMPFVKVELLRDNPLRLTISHWREVLGAQGVDCAKVEAHIAIRRGVRLREKSQKSGMKALLSQVNHLRLRLHRKLRRKPRRLV